ncbi:CDP-glucose 4,6-dehydratase [Clostridium sp. LP20]|uniref:CDP-glucose 4,6-dehydratase n=1 Tax=Clostridium sp. LP20 TaxID=3418665 RepID=UPI003EE6CB36
MENMELDIFDGFYKDKVVLVTGHTGFKGSWLSLWLQELGAKVIGYSLDPENNEDNFNVSRLSSKIVDIRGDIRDFKKLDDVFNQYKPEMVFHLAAQPLVRESYNNPRETYEINVMGTLNVLEAIKNSNSVKVGVMITTDKCYENKERIWGYREYDPMGGYDPYSSSKGCCELLISSYRNSFFNLEEYDMHNKAIASVRAGNVVGGGDFAKDRIIPDCIRSIRNNEKISVRSPEAIRPWQHVLEPLYGYMLLGRRLYEDGKLYSEGWNFGPSDELQVRVSEIVNLIIRNFGEGSWEDKSEKKGVHEANLLTLDCTKARIRLGWSSIMSIDETIEYTAKWYRDFKEDMYMFNVNQISDYCKLRRGVV